MELNDIIKPENLVYEKPRLMNENPMHYCPGCSHGVIHKLIAEVIADMGLEDKTIGISPVGCAVFAYNYLDIDWIEAAHGRAPAIASAVKRLNPEKMVFTYQGDGDLAAIGTAETIHAANRGENIVIVFVNNAIYGMIGGQCADICAEELPADQVTKELLWYIHKNKTAALIEAALMIGAVLAGASDEEVKKLEQAA